MFSSLLRFSAFSLLVACGAQTAPDPLERDGLERDDTVISGLVIDQVMAVDHEYVGTWITVCNTSDEPIFLGDYTLTVHATETPYIVDAYDFADVAYGRRYNANLETEIFEDVLMDRVLAPGEAHVITDSNLSFQRTNGRPASQEVELLDFGAGNDLIVLSNTRGDIDRFGESGNTFLDSDDEGAWRNTFAKRLPTVRTPSPTYVPEEWDLRYSGIGDPFDCSAPVEACSEDADGDGFNVCEDCDDENAEAYPGAPESCDGVDTDCDGTLEEDTDDDGMLDCASCGTLGEDAALTGDDLRIAIALMPYESCTPDDLEWSAEQVWLDDGELSAFLGGLNHVEADVLWLEEDGWVWMNQVASRSGEFGYGEGCDAHNLFPIGNPGSRSDEPFGMVIDIQEANGGRVVGWNADDETVMQVAPAARGDVARAVLYMHVSYEQPLDHATLALMKQWNIDDPVDADEVERHVMNAFKTGRPNVFVECPTLVAAL